MRIEIKMKPIEGKISLPFYYYHALQNVVYTLLGKEKGDEYHANDSIKNIVFSNLFGPYELDQANKQIIYTDTLTWCISSINASDIQAILSNIIKSNIVELFYKKLYITSFCVQLGSAKVSKVLIETLSPITVHRTIDIDGKSKTLYYEPGSEEFDDLITQNLIHKKESLGFKDTTTNIRLIPNGRHKKAIVDYDRFIVVGYQGLFELEGNPDDINLAYHIGLGDRNTQGFGMFKVLKKLD